MTKAPILAIIVSIIALFSIYLFADIRPPASTENNIVVNDNSGVSSDVMANAFIDNYNTALQVTDKEYVESLLSSIENPLSTSNPLVALDSLISFYEKHEQYNFAAWYHSHKATILQTSASWSLAGDRQYSVSQNAVYNHEFNFALYTQAIVSYTKALNLDTNRLDVQVKLANCYLDNQEQTMQGITLLLDVVAKDSLNVDANILLGKFGIVSTQYEKAVQRLENVLSLQPENTEALFLLAEAYNGLGETQKAINLFTTCRDLVENEALKKEIDGYIQQLSL